jgi:hypothetical protein
MWSDSRQITARLALGARVADVGGGAIPYERADVVIDVVPRPSGPVKCLDGTMRTFGPNEWMSLDANGRVPVADKTFDFVFSSHLLEDIRDPIAACREMQRIGRAGFIQTPSRACEATFGIQGTLFPGFMHHRWYVETDGADGLIFTFKSPLLCDCAYLGCDAAPYREESTLSFWWVDQFPVTERSTQHRYEIVADLVRFKAEQEGHSVAWIDAQVSKLAPAFRDDLGPRLERAMWRRVAAVVRDAHLAS